MARAGAPDDALSSRIAASPPGRRPRPSTLARRKALKRKIAKAIGTRAGHCTTSDIQSDVGGHRADILALIRELVAEGDVVVGQDPADRRRHVYTLARPRAAACDQCRRPLPPGKKRFCSDDCRARKQKAERITENETYARSVVRQIRSMGRRASADLDALAWLAGAADHARAALAMAVDGCRAQGYSDGEIGAALGITRQAVGQRFGRKHDLYAGQQEHEVPA
jgi:hypothetical protein